MPGAVLCGGDRAGTGEREDRHRGVGTIARGAAAGGGCGAGNRRRGDGGRPNGGHPRIALQLIRPLNTPGGVWMRGTALRWGEGPERFFVGGIEPEIVKTGIGVSEPVRAALRPAVAAARAIVEEVMAGVPTAAIHESPSSLSGR